MKRSGPIKRNKPLRPGKPMARKPKAKDVAAYARLKAAMMGLYPDECFWCGGPWCDVSHLRTKSAHPRFKYDVRNVRPSCRPCHDKWEPLGVAAKQAWLDDRCPQAAEFYRNVNKEVRNGS